MTRTDLLLALGQGLPLRSNQFAPACQCNVLEVTAGLPLDLEEDVCVTASSDKAIILEFPVVFGLVGEFGAKLATGFVGKADLIGGVSLNPGLIIFQVFFGLFVC